MTQQFANQAQSVLTSAYTAGDSVIYINNGAVFPSSGNFTLAIGYPVQFYLQCTARSGNALTVTTSGQEGTSMINMVVGTVVTQVITAGVLQDLKADAITLGSLYGPYASLSSVTGMVAGFRYKCTGSPYEFIYNGSSWQAFVFGYAVTEPVLSSFVQVKTDLSTFDTTHGGFLWTISANSSYDTQVLSQTSSLIGAGAYYVDAAFVVDIGSSNGKIATHLAAGTTTSSAFTRSSFGWESNNIFYLCRSRWNSPTSWESNAGTCQITIASPLMWLRVYDDGTTNRYFYSSATGYNWILRYTEDRTSLFTTAAVGMSFDTFASTISTVHCVHYSVHT
jgi:hypothetical protein